MVRKQLYINDDQERLLKSRSTTLGVSEAELVRRALDSMLSQSETSLARPRTGGAIQAFLAEAERIARAVAIVPPARREDLYAERIGGPTEP